MIITPKDLACLQIQFKVSKEVIQKAVAKVGNNRDEIEQYLQQQAKPHLVQLLNSNSLSYPNHYH
jgi:hypothetical protein